MGDYKRYISDDVWRPMLAKAGLEAWSWLPIYESEHDVANGEKWALHVVLDDGMALNSMGLNAWPNGYDTLVEGLLGLFDGRGAI